MDSSDPNADLVGFKYVSGTEEIEVLGTPEWSEQYVTVRFPTGYTTIKPAGIVRWVKTQQESKENADA